MPSLRITLLLAALIGLITVPLPSVQPSAGLDASWGFALHTWAVDHDLPTTYFTYGPLGFLTVPVDWNRLTFALAVAFVVGLQLSFCWLVLTRLVRICPVPLALFLTWVLASLPLANPAEELMLVGILAAAELLQAGTLRPGAWVAGFTLVSGLVLLTKFSTGLVWVGASAVVAATQASGRWRRALAGVVTVGSSVLVAWAGFAVTTGRGGDFGAWLRGSQEVAAGYYTMAVEPLEVGTSSYVAAGLVLAGLACLCLALVARHTEPTTIAASLLVLGGAYVLFREGFTRHDSGHEAIFYSCMTALPLALVLGRRSRWLVLPLLLLTVDLGVLQAHALHPQQQLASWHRIAALRANLSDLASADDVQRQARLQIRGDFPMEAPVLAALDGHRVQVDPFSTAVLWGYGLSWGPSSVWALYSSYTPWLDEHNALSIQSAQGPDRILRQLPAPSVDGRFAAWESPHYRVIEACRWSAVLRTPHWQVLAPSANRCGSPVELGRVSFAPGTTVTVPAPRHAGSVVTVRFELRTAVSERLATLLFKPHRSFIRLNGLGHPFPFGLANAAQPHLLVVPGGLPAPNVQQFSLDQLGTAVFEELPPV